MRPQYMLVNHLINDPHPSRSRQRQIHMVKLSITDLPGRVRSIPSPVKPTCPQYSIRIGYVSCPSRNL